LEESGENDLGNLQHVNYKFSGSVIELQSEFANHRNSFNFLLKNYAGFYDPSAILIRFIEHHGLRGGKRESCVEESGCPL